MEIEKVNDYKFRIKKKGNMKVPVEVYVTEKMLNKLKEDKSLQQGANVAGLPGIYTKSIMLPER